LPTENEDSRAAFGIALTIDPRIEIAGLAASPGVALEPPSIVRLHEGELDRRWEACGVRPVRARELRFGQTVLLSVDFADTVGYLLWTRDFGRVLISADGMELLCDPDGVSSEWVSILLAQALPLAATIRGLEVLHASGVELNGKAVLVAGPQGAGKSSLAAALVRGGGRLLGDDAIALQLSEGALIAHAGSAVLQLREGEDRRLTGADRAALGRAVGSDTAKRRYVSPSTCQAAPFGALFLLERSDRQPTVERLESVDPFELIASTFNLSVRTPARLQRQLDVISAIASNGQTHRLRVQRGVDSTELASVVIEQLGVVSV
jgi:hypothetical protein